MKKYQKIVLAGGAGYLGGVLADHYRELAHEVVILSRKAAPTKGNVLTIQWDGLTEGDWANSLEDADLLVNLCGKSVNCRYTESNKQQIFDSRLIPTALLGRAIGQLAHPPKLWINVTSATIYRHAEDHAQDELTGELGSGFSVEVCKQWEQVFFAAHTPFTRKVALRMGIVLGRDSAVFPLLMRLVKLGLGGRQGNGDQYVNWIHERDAARISEWLLQHPGLDGVVNATAPNAVRNRELMQMLRQSYGIPLGIPSPQWLLEIGAWLIGTETELMLKSRWVAPQRLLDSGYQFSFAQAKHAVNDILSTRT